MDFLQSVAKYYIEKYSDKNDWSDLCFVFPSHRAGVFFRKTLQQMLGERVIFGCEIITLDDFIAEKAKRIRLASGEEVRLVKADNITLAFELYLAYKEVMNGLVDNISDFDTFYSWSAMFLGDFDDADKYMVNVEDLFKTVSDYETLSDNLSYLSETQVKTIEAFWNIKFTEVTENSLDGSGVEQVNYYYEKFVETYEKLYDLYVCFNKRLDERKLSYAGKMYRMVAEMYGSMNQPDDDNHYAFIGFNALTKSECEIFNALNRSKEGRVEFFWDYPEEIVTDLRVGDRNVKMEHGPGRFIRDFKEKYKSPIEPPKREEEREINIIKYAYPQGQVEHVGDFVRQQWNSETGITPRTAIVLTDENMLLPVLSSLPMLGEDNSSGYTANVTMGYPLKFSQVYGLVDLLARFQRDIKNGNGTGFYHKLVTPILQHPWVHRAAEEEADKMLMDIVLKNRVTIEAEEFEGKGVLQTIFRKVEPNDVPAYVKDIFTCVYDTAIKSKESLVAECAYKVIKVITRFEEILKGYIGNSSLELNDSGLVMSMVDSIVQSQTVDFLGEPLAGLQIMGILETRAVDFDNIVILDMNEGIFPKKSTSMTFIPYTIRKSFEMPTHEYQDSIFSYYFFRLINRAKKVDILYSESNDSNRQGVSRFVQQIKYEFEYKYTEQTAVHRLNILPDCDPVLEKTPEVMQMLKERFCGNKYLSPSALTNYMKCPILFFLDNVLNIDDMADVLEEADPRIIGTIFHNTMESIYIDGKYLGENGVFDDGVREKILNSGIIEKTVRDNFDRILHLNGKSLEGRNIILERVISKLVETLVKLEPNGFKFIKAEGAYTSNITLDGGASVNIGGIIDRQHEEGGVHYVVDYKTGVVGTNIKFDDIEKYIEKLFDRKDDGHDKYKAILQTLVYCKLLYDNDLRDGKKDMSYHVGVIYLKDLLGAKKLDFKITKGDKDKKEELVYDKEFDELFTAKLKTIVSEIFSNEDFKCSDKKKCSNRNRTCRFYSICHKPKADFGGVANVGMI